MEKERNNKTFLIWIEDLLEELEIQFYGILGAILFFVILYFIFQPIWMINLLDFFLKSKLPLVSILKY